MSQQHGRAGHSTYWMAAKRAGLAILCLGVALGLMWMSQRLVPRRTSLAASVALPLLLGVVIVYLATIGKALRRRSDPAERGRRR